MSQDPSQIVAYLSSPDAFGGGGPVDVVETHGAYVFLCGDTALKLKRAVRYDYMDLSTATKRRAMLRRELELNRPAAPEIYRDVLPVTRRQDGTLDIGGAGDPVDWVLRMHRFDPEDELEAVAARGGLDDRLAAEIGRAIAAYHAAAPERRQPGAPLIAAILDELARVFAEYPGAPGTEEVAAWLAEARTAHARVAPILDRRGNAGHVRRAHGDLHLRNLVLIEGRPVPFDALEFDETLGTCDLLYDLGFLLMDLCHRDLARPACRVLDAWLLAFDGSEDAGLAALPLFLSVRATIRAMVGLQTDAARGQAGHSAEDVARYMAQARGYLAPAPPRLVAVGGLSGTGKSVLARALAPLLGAAPGAVLLSSDVVRKAGRADAGRLDAQAYTPQARGAVYERMCDRAAALLAAGQSVLLDATFLDPTRREAAARVAAAAGVPLDGLWLTAPQGVLERRVSDRRGDASDADLAVLRRQLAAAPAPPNDWHRLEAGTNAADTLAAARTALGC